MWNKCTLYVPDLFTLTGSVETADPRPDQGYALNRPQLPQKRPLAPVRYLPSQKHQRLSVNLLEGFPVKCIYDDLQIYQEQRNP